MKIEYIESIDLDKKLYKGIWYGAKNNPISVKNLLDKVIKQKYGFTIKKQNKFTSDNLLDDSSETIYYLIDEDGRGKFKLDDTCIDYLLANLPIDSYLRSRLEG